MSRFSVSNPARRLFAPRKPFDRVLYAASAVLGFWTIPAVWKIGDRFGFAVFLIWWVIATLYTIDALVYWIRTKIG